MTSLQLSVENNHRIRWRDQSIDWDQLRRILLWPDNVRFDLSSMKRANEFVQRFPGFQTMLNLQTQFQPLLSQVQTTGFVLSQGWFTTLKPLRGRVMDFERRFEVDSTLPLREKLHQLGDKLTQQGIRISPEWGWLVNHKDDNTAIKELLDYRNNSLYLNRFGQDLEVSGMQTKLGFLLKGTWDGFASYTGRLSCSHPPLMAFPKAMKQYWRSPFKGEHLLSVDLSSIELRIASAITDCKLMQQRLEAGQDIHAINGMIILSVLELNADVQLRHQLGKRVMYTLLYGGGIERLRKTISKLLARNVTSTQVLKIRIRLQNEYPELFTLQNVDKLWVSMPFGRVPLSVELKHTTMVNLPVQAYEAVILKQALLATKDLAHVVLPIHDEVVYSVPVQQTTQLTQQLTERINVVLADLLPALVTKNIATINDMEEKSYEVN